MALFYFYSSDKVDLVSITIDDKLNFEYHISEIPNVPKKVLRLINNRTKASCSISDMFTLYNVCAVPWGCSVPWGYADARGGIS